MKKLFLMGLNFLFAGSVFAQDADFDADIDFDVDVKKVNNNVYNTFIMPGINVEIPNGHNILAMGGVTIEKHTQMLMVTPAFKVNKWLTLKPRYIYMSTPKAHSEEANEHQFDFFARLSFPLDKKGKWILQNRSGYFLRSVQHGEVSQFARARLGLVHSTKIGKTPLAVFAHDEIYIDLKNGNFNRNRIYAGAEVRLLDWLYPRFLYVYQTTRESDVKAHLLLVGMVVPLNNYGFFKGKKAKK